MTTKQVEGMAEFMPLPSKDEKSQQVRKKASAKFRNPETQETWSGRGCEPAWIKGKDRSEFTLNKGTD